MAFLLAFLLVTINILLPHIVEAMDLEDIPSSLQESVVLLSGEKGCATGFLVQDQILTNAHVTGALCSYGECDPLTVMKMDSVEAESWEYFENQEAVIVQEVPTLDVALLKVPKISSESISPTNFSQGEVGGLAFILGFPGCGDFTLTEGKILAKTPTGFRTSAEIQKGSSGSPVFNENFEIIGVAMRSSSLLGGIAALPLNTPTSTDFVDIGYAQRVLWAKDSEMALIEMKLLNSIYRDVVVSSRGLNRMRVSSDFIMAADVVLRRSSFLQLDRETLFALFIGRENSLNFLRHPFNASTPELLEAEKLGMAYALEMYGFRNEAFEEIDVSSFLKDLRNSGRPYHHIQQLEQLISEAQENKPADLIFSFILISGLVLPLLAVWGWSLGYVFRGTNGNWYIRILKMVAVGLALWPLSLIVFWLVNKPSFKSELITMSRVSS